MRKNRDFTRDLLNPKYSYLITIHHYAIADGALKRFVIPNLIAGDQVAETVRSLAGKKNIFKIVLRYSNFPHTDQLFLEICQQHKCWSTRINAYENRIPYLQLSNLTLHELEFL